MSTFLEMCQNVCDEWGIAGGAAGLTSVSSTLGEYGRIVRFVREANYYVQNLHIDWNFLWYDYSETLAAGAVVFPAATAVAGVVARPRYWVRESLWLNRVSTNPIKLDYVPWDRWREMHRTGVVRTQQPGYFSVRPDNVIELDAAADKAYTASGQFYRRPFTLSANADTPVLPEEFHRIIELKAAYNYGVREDAPEIISGVMAEYDDMLEKMEAAQLPGQEANTMGFDEDSRMEIP